MYNRNFIDRTKVCYSKIFNSYHVVLLLFKILKNYTLNWVSFGLISRTMNKYREKFFTYKVCGI